MESAAESGWDIKETETVSFAVTYVCLVLACWCLSVRSNSLFLAILEIKHSIERSISEVNREGSARTSMLVANLDLIL